MAFLTKGKKEDLRRLAEEMGLAPAEDLRILDIKQLILKSDKYEENSIKNMLTSIIEERVEKHKEAEKVAEQERRKAEMDFELQKLKLQLEAQKSGVPLVNNADIPEQPKLELKKLIPSFNSKEDDMAIFLQLFERQLKFLKVPDSQWVAYLIGALPSDIAALIARESEEESQNFAHIKEMLLKRFHLSAEKFRQLFRYHKKVPERTWRDYYFKVKSYFEGWIQELKIENFNQLKDLIISDQIKRWVPPEVRDHFLDDWSELVSPSELVDKLDVYCNIRNTTPSVKKTTHSKEYPFKSYASKRDSPDIRCDKTNQAGSTSTFNRRDKWKTDDRLERPSVSCYGCGKPGVTKPRCPNCKPASSKDSANFSNISLHSCSSTPNQSAVLKLAVNGTWGTACADSGASHSIAGETLYLLLQKEGVDFQKTRLTMTLADGHKSEVEVYTTSVVIRLEGRVIRTPLIALPYAKANRTLLGMDFLQRAGIVLNLKQHKWFFCDSPIELMISLKK